MLEIKNLKKQYHEQTIFTNLNWTFKSRGLYFVVGKSGQGKTTLFNLIGKIDREYEGQILFNGKDIREIPNYQGHCVSYLFQSPTLVNELGCKSNYRLPAVFNRVIDRLAQKQILEKLSISLLGTRSVLKISGGQKSRVALMRALMSNPGIILADEPTAALDRDNSSKVLEFLKEQAKTRLVIVVTHDLDLIDPEATGVVDLDNVTMPEEVVEVLDHDAGKPSRHRLFNLACKWLLLDLGTSLKMTAGIVLALVTVMITVVVALGLKDEVNLELNQLFGTAAYSSRLKSQQSMTLGDMKPLKEDPLITHMYLLLDEYELVGLALYEDAGSGDIVAINDPTKARPDEFAAGPGIVISKSMAGRLGISQDGPFEAYLYFSFHEQLKSVKVAIDGISNANEIVDTVYFNEMAPLEMAAQLFHEPVANIGGSIVTIAGTDLSLSYLEESYPEFQFKILGASLKTQVNSLLDNINLALLLFSSLSLVASLFLIGAVMYLGVVKNRRNLGIFMTMGATRSDLAVMIMVETLILVTCGALVASLYVAGLVALVNTMVKDAPGINILSGNFLSFELPVALGVFGLMLFISLMASLVPALIASRQDIKKVLAAR